MQIKFNEELKKKLAKIASKDKKLSRRIEKQLGLFIENPKHSSLRLHKLSGKMQNLYSISISISIRMIYIENDKENAYFIDIGTHDEVYKK